MALFTIRDLPPTQFRISSLIKEASAPLDRSFDIFLSHSYRNRALVPRVQLALSQLGYEVYVDWMIDDDMSRTDVTRDTAARVKTRIEHSRALLVCVTEQVAESRWMPWELGIADGMGKRVGVLPVFTAADPRDDYEGLEYLGLYPYVDKALTRGRTGPYLWANRSSFNYVRFDSWLDGGEPEDHPR